MSRAGGEERRAIGGGVGRARREGVQNHQVGGAWTWDELRVSVSGGLMGVTWGQAFNIRNHPSHYETVS